VASIDIAVTPTPGGGGGAPTDAAYVLIAADGTLPNERVLTAGTDIAIVDGGVGGNVTVSYIGGGGGTGFTMAPQTFLARASGTTGPPEIVLGSTATSFLSIFGTGTRGVVPGPTASQISGNMPLLASGVWSPTNVGIDSTRSLSGLTVNQNSNTSFLLNYDGGSGIFSVNDFSTTGTGIDTTRPTIFLTAATGEISTQWVSFTRYATAPIAVTGFPGVIAKTDNKLYFDNAAGSTMQLTAPIITQLGGTQIAYSTRTFNFTGAGVTASVTGELVDVTISGGGGGGLTEAQIYARIAYGM